MSKKSLVLSPPGQNSEYAPAEVNEINEYSLLDFSKMFNCPGILREELPQLKMPKIVNLKWGGNRELNTIKAGKVVHLKLLWACMIHKGTIKRFA